MEPSGKRDRGNPRCRRQERSLGILTLERGQGQEDGTALGKTEAAQPGEEGGRKVSQAGSTSLRGADSASGDHVLGGFASFLWNPPNRLNCSRGRPLHTNRQGANLQRWERASGSSEEPEPVPSTSGVSEIAARPPPPSLITDGPSVLPPGSNSSCLFTPCQPCMPVIVQWCLSRFCTVGLKMFSFCVCFLCIICAKSIINLLRAVLYS